MTDSPKPRRRPFSRPLADLQPGQPFKKKHLVRSIKLADGRHVEANEKQYFDSSPAGNVVHLMEKAGRRPVTRDSWPAYEVACLYVVGRPRTEPLPSNVVPYPPLAQGDLSVLEPVNERVPKFVFVHRILPKKG